MRVYSLWMCFIAQASDVSIHQSGLLLISVQCVNFHLGWDRGAQSNLAPEW